MVAAVAAATNWIKFQAAEIHQPHTQIKTHTQKEIGKPWQWQHILFNFNSADKPTERETEPEPESEPESWNRNRTRVYSPGTNRA